MVELIDDFLAEYPPDHVLELRGVNVYEIRQVG
jgi:hypothetical protein